MSEPISINVKASNDQKYVVSIQASMTVLEFKQKIAESCDTPADRMRLIYSGRVLKDADTLETYKIADGNTVHMVRGAAPAGSSAAASSTPSAAVSTTPAAVTTPTPSTTTTPATSAGKTPRACALSLSFSMYPFGAGAGAMPNPWASMMGGGGGMGGMGGMGGLGGMGGMPGMDPAVMNQMMQDPNFAQYMSNMLQNPQVIESMMAMNPSLAAMGPEFREMIR
ncbi:hypothetical protein BGZ99_010206, partial [Dissophora globulifera]